VATDRLGSVVYKFGTGLAVGNGTFESGVVAPWAPYGEAQISTSTVAHTGSRSMRLTTPVADRKTGTKPGQPDPSHQGF
jgi:hypothetical protein